MNDRAESEPIPVELDDLENLQIQQAMEQLQGEESFVTAFLAGSAAALLGAILWAVITATTDFQIGFMAVGVGFMVGLAIRHFGKGVSTKFGVLGAGLSLVGCLLGNLLAIATVISEQEGMPVTEVLSNLDFKLAVELMTLTFHPMDILFYGLALYYGYKLSFRKLTPELLNMPSQPGL